MLIRWLGPRVARRVVGNHVWDAGNGFVCEVSDRELAEGLLADASGLFVVEPFSEGLTVAPAVEDQKTAGETPAKSKEDDEQ